MSENLSNNATGVRLLNIVADQAGQRIDNFLISLLKGVPRSRIYRILRKGEVRVNKGRVKADYRLQSGDQIRIPPVRVAEKEQAQRPGNQILNKIIASILYEDDYLLIINKPSGLAVHGGSGLNYGAIEALRHLYPEKRNLELVHRLDRDTSGCLLLAKKRSVLKQLHELFRNNAIKKRYCALVQGEWQGGHKLVDAPLMKNVLQSGERIVRVNAEGKQARSNFKPVSRYKGATLVDIDLLTGRTHQIRVHANHIGHPIAGDEKYGDSAFNTAMKQKGIKRLFLHAKSLTLQHPNSGETLKIDAPLDDELQVALKQLTEHKLSR